MSVVELIKFYATNGESVFPTAIHNNKLFIFHQSTGFTTFDPSTNATTVLLPYDSPQFTNALFSGIPSSMVIYNNIVYMTDVNGKNIYRYNITNNALDRITLYIANKFLYATVMVYPDLYGYYDNTSTGFVGLARINVSNVITTTSTPSFSVETYMSSTMVSNGQLPPTGQLPKLGFNSMFLDGNDLYLCYFTKASPYIDGYMSYAPSILKVNITNKTSTVFLTDVDNTVDEPLTGCTVYNGYIYVAATYKIHRYKLTDTSIYDSPYATTTTVTITGVNGGVYKTIFMPSNLVVLNQTLFMTQPSNEAANNDPIFTATIAKVALTAPAPTLSPPLNSISLDVANTTVVSSGNLRVSIIDPSNTLANGVYYEYSINSGGYINSNVYAGSSPSIFYVLSTDISNTILIRANNSAGSSTPITIPSNLSIIYQIPRTPTINSIALISSGNVSISIKETSPPPYYYLNNVSYYLYAYNTFGGPNLSGNTSLLVYNRPVGILSNTNFTYGNVVSYVNNGLNANTYTMYVIARNDFGNSNPVAANIAVFTSPLPTVSIDTVNTKTVASGNLQVRIIDLSNTSLNGVYYQYALNSFADVSFANTFVRASTSPYTFFIPFIRDISNTLYVRASNAVGNSSPVASLQVIVYQTPRTPSQVGFQLVNSGNVKVTIQETNPPPYYYLNNVSYYLYAYNTFGGPNLSGNTSLLVYNRPVGILSNTNFTYGNVVSYVNNGLNSNTYTMYVIARNDFGNSNPFSANISVMVPPSIAPIIDIGNTKSTSSGSLTITFTDTLNSASNSIEYVYYLEIQK